MKKKTLIVIAVILIALILLTMFGSKSEKGTIKEFVDDAVIVALDDGKTVVRIEDYHTYISTDEEIAVGERVKIKCALFNDMRILGIYHLDE